MIANLSLSLLALEAIFSLTHVHSIQTEYRGELILLIQLLSLNALNKIIARYTKQSASSIAHLFFLLASLLHFSPFHSVKLLLARRSRCLLLHEEK